MSCKNKNNCNCPECKNSGCKDISYTSCIKYEGPNGECLNIVNGESMDTIFKKIDSKFCEVTSNKDKYVATSVIDNAPSYLFSKLLNDVTIIWSIVNIDGELKVTANVDVDYIVNQIINTPELISLFCGNC